MIRSNRGGTLVMVLITAALLSVVALLSATLVHNSNLQNQIAASRAATMPLAAALRTQLARHASCVASFAPAPASYAAPGEVGVMLGTTAVKAGAELYPYGLRVTSLALANLSKFGTTSSGNAIYLADLVLKTQSEALESGNRVEFRPVTAAHLSFEVQGANTLVSCNATDPDADLAGQLTQVCTSIASIEGVPGSWSGTNCVVSDASAPTRCGSIGGTWMGTWCSFAPPTFTVSRVVSGVPGQTFYGVDCPAGTSLMGGTCATTAGPNPPLGGAVFGNGYYCQWNSGYEASQFTITATCAP